MDSPPAVDKDRLTTFGKAFLEGAEVIVQHDAWVLLIALARLAFDRYGPERSQRREGVFRVIVVCVGDSFRLKDSIIVFRVRFQPYGIGDLLRQELVWLIIGTRRVTSQRISRHDN